MTPNSVITLHRVHSLLFLILNQPLPLFLLIQFVFKHCEKFLLFFLIPNLRPDKLLVDLVLVNEFFCLSCTTLCLLVVSLFLGMTCCFISNARNFYARVRRELCFLLAKCLFFFERFLSLCHLIIVVLWLASQLWVFLAFVFPFVFLLLDQLN